MSKTPGSSSNVSLNVADRPTCTRTPSRKCWACDCQQEPQESSRTGRKSTPVKPNNGTAHHNTPRKVGPDVLPSVARARSSVHLRPDSFKNKAGKPTTEVVSADTSAALEVEETSSPQMKGGAKEIVQVSQKPRVKKRAAIPPQNTAAVKTATPRQIWRKKSDLTLSKSKTLATPKRVPAKLPSEDIGIGYHIIWDGFEGFEEPVHRLGQDCCLCEADLAVASTESENETEFSTLPVVAMLPCGHAFHVNCLDQGELADDEGIPSCVLCQSLM